LPKPILNIGCKQESLSTLSLHSISSVRTIVEPMVLDKMLRRKRSNEYIKVMKQLDIGGHEVSGELYESFISAVRSEFPDVPFSNQPVGIISKCFLGAPYEVHTIDVAGSIIQHYKTSESLPPFMAKARSIAIHGGYEFIEVYIDSMRAIKADGTVSVVK